MSEPTRDVSIEEHVDETDELVGIYTTTIVAATKQKAVRAFTKYIDRYHAPVTDKDIERFKQILEEL